jgi:hypothetical protein
VSIPNSDEDGEMPADEGAMVPSGSEWTAMPHSMILSTEVTVPMMEEVRVTSVLKFTVPDTFTVEGMKGWLASAMKRVVGGHWRRIVRIEWCPRAHYYVEFDTDNSALCVKGLVDAKDGTVRLVEFTRSREFNEMLDKHGVIASQPITPPPLPFKRPRPAISTKRPRSPAASSAHRGTSSSTRWPMHVYEPLGFGSTSGNYYQHSRSPYRYSHSPLRTYRCS